MEDRRQHQGIQAFTLIELMVVIVLLGIMTAMILPEMKGTYQDALLRSTSRDLVSVCDLASSHAISLNRALMLRFDVAAGRYFLEPPRLDNQANPALRDVPGGQGRWDTRISIAVHKVSEDFTEAAGERAVPVLARRLQLGRQEQEIAFYPDGTADASEIMLRDQDGFGLALRINPITARVRIIELTRE
jgi:prepilin-type N-terminal cleavage/methylation domain-containing protein